MSRIGQGWLYGPAIMEDVFGTPFHGREIIDDPMNKQLFNRMLNNYIKQHQAMGYKFHPEFESDLSYLKILKTSRWFGAAAGVTFAATVVNPNYMSRRSYYGRKI